MAATRTGTHGERGVLRTTGSFQSVRGWTDARLNRALRLLADLDHGTDTTSRGRRTRGRRGAFDRPILAWESHLDDLGTPDRDTPEAQALEYQNILEFVDRLDQLSGSSMGMDYNPEFDPGAMDAMPRVRIAGAAVGVHPRALYFAAAAQVGMDEREGRAGARGTTFRPVGCGPCCATSPTWRRGSRPSGLRAAAAERRGAVRAARRSPAAARSTRRSTANCSARCTSSRTRRRRGHRSRPSPRRASRARVAGVPRRPRRAHPRPRADGERRGRCDRGGAAGRRVGRAPRRPPPRLRLDRPARHRARDGPRRRHLPRRRPGRQPDQLRHRARLLAVHPPADRAPRTTPPAWTRPLRPGAGGTSTPDASRALAGPRSRSRPCRAGGDRR